MSTPFNQTITCLGDPIVIREEPLSKGLGYTDESTGTIVIDSRQPEAGKHVILLHELLHLVDAMLVQSGLRKRRVDHEFIRHAAPNLLLVLVAAGMWKGLDFDDLADFMEGQDT